MSFQDLLVPHELLGPHDVALLDEATAKSLGVLSSSELGEGQARKSTIPRALARRIVSSRALGIPVADFSLTIGHKHLRIWSV